jgi:membrane protein
MDYDTIRYLAVEPFKEWREDKASRLAAALSYYTILSLPPLLIISLAIAGRFYSRQVAQDQLLSQAQALVGQTASQAIDQILQNASDPTLSSIAAIVSFALLLFGASGVFSELQESMNAIWEVESKPGRGLMGTIKDRFFSFVLVLGVGFLFLVFLVLSSILPGLNETMSGIGSGLLSAARILNFVISLGVITVLFALIFKFVPDVEISWSDVWLGAFVTAVLFNVGKWGIGLYLGRSATTSAYGAAGSLVVLLLWIYYSAQILFLGAEFTQVYAHRFGDHILPDQDAVALDGPHDQAGHAAPS